MKAEVKVWRLVGQMAVLWELQLVDKKDHLLAEMKEYLLVDQ